MWLMLLLFSSTVTFSDIQQIPPEQIVQMHTGQKISLRGFPYRTDDGRWIISDEPALKSCCIGRGPKANKQVFLEGEHEEFAAHQVIEVEGTLAMERGRLILKEWNAKEEKPFPWKHYGLLFGVILLGILGRKAFQWYRR